MGVFGAPHRLFFCNSFVQNKVTEIVALVLGRLKYKMTFLLQGIRGRGRSHPVYSDIHIFYTRIFTFRIIHILKGKAEQKNYKVVVEK